MRRYEKLSKICRKYGVALLYLFGSQQDQGLALLSGEKCEPRDALSDIDVGVVIKGGLPPAYPRAKLYARIYNELEELFRPFRLDLTFLQENHSVFQLEAVARGQCVYAESEEFRENYEMSILRRAADFRWVLEKFYEEKLSEF
ncbi:MAG: nucleotidyltransferase domain-containing protein [Syntrophothermus sp.]|uniref:nucleotidyltransferase domain-containing protein n=1 Tax=Syntrophothermus sp. TaxID=2736299 RepID=UPI002579D907|nr:nucleotidyltransferase domain-containing protein [Syntrophothermus sp.]NSW83242.1 nucleotidyltransferase domain-containing protein [Syntrophothermus sp.]